MDEGHCAKRGTAKVVWTQAGTMAGVSAELAKKKAPMAELKRAEKTNGTLTLLFGAKDKEHNQAVVLLNLLKK